MVENPFSVITPEEMDAEKASLLFVEMHSDYPQIRRPGNAIITGARGCGKSMLIRCSLPDVLMIKDKKQSSELDYLAICVPIKRTALNLTELQILDNRHAPYLINEHFMALHVLLYSLYGLSKITYDTFSEKAYVAFYQNTYKRYMELSGCKDEINVIFSDPKNFFLSLYEHTEKLRSDFINYIAQIPLNTDNVNYSYSLPLLSFLRFIVPVFNEITNLPGFPKKKYVLFFIDDADNLSKIQTEILNSWLACRTQPIISLKISTQIGQYKTYLSSSGVLVESPHDYQAVNISYRYTTDIARGSNYYEKAVHILKKRLTHAGIDVEPKDFFPPYEKQELGIAKEKEKIKEEYKKLGGRSSRLDDDIRRYAVPNYIKSLGGISKSRPTYRYAGLENIIHLSSGIIRNLLDAAAMMFDVKANTIKNLNIKPSFIDTEIQNNIMKQQADHFLFTELIKSEHKDDEGCALNPIKNPSNDAEKLQNLISAMGGTFHEILVSDRSERKVFSVALSNIPDSELKRVFQLGVRLGFLHEMRIGNKEGNGRTMLYVLNRCFAPLFTLDPTGFQGYLFMTNDDLHKAIIDGKYLRNITKKDVDEDLRQLTFDDIWEDEKCQM
jgi:hypothetical protein